MPPFIKTTVLIFLSAAPFASGEDAVWKSLFNGRDLDGWSVAVEGAPIGSDPKGHVVVRDGCIHMYADTPEDQRGDFGVIVTDGTYSRYHLEMEYAWGEKRFAPRQEELRDAGLLYHIANPNQRVLGIWPVSMECQIQEGDTGDLVFLQVRAYSWLHPEQTRAPQGKGVAGLLPELGGVPTLCALKENFYVGRYPVHDTLDGWNRVEAIVHGSESAVHLVNGKIRSRVLQLASDDHRPLDAGHLALQLEAAEIRYRNIRIRELAKPLAPARRCVALSHVRGLASSPTQLEIHNPGPTAVPLDLAVSGSHAQYFRASLPDGAASSLAPGEKISIQITFQPDVETAPDRYSAGLQVGPMDLGAFVVLQGLVLAAPEGKNEPPLQRIVHALGIPLDVGGSALELDTKAPTIGAAVAATSLVRARAGEVRVTALARFSPAGEIPLRWHARGVAARRPIATLASSQAKSDAHQCLFPPWTDGEAPVGFDPGVEPFSLVAETSHGAIPLDPAHAETRLAHPARVFPVQAVHGMPVKDAVLVCFEEASNGDYQDAVFLLENVRAVR